MEVRDDVLKSLEAARNEKLIGAPLEARVRASANGELYPLLEQYAARVAGAVHRVAGGSWSARAARRSEVKVERAAGAEVRTLLEVHHRYRLPTARFPTICGPCAERRRRDAEWLMPAVKAYASRRRRYSALDRLTKRIMEQRVSVQRHATA